MARYQTRRPYGGANRFAMTFRVYVRWPHQRVSQKTSTESRAVADIAFTELRNSSDVLKRQGALGIAFSEDGKSLDYLPLNEDARHSGGS